jgi:hypothetical protein
MFELHKYDATIEEPFKIAYGIKFEFFANMSLVMYLGKVTNTTKLMTQL